MSEQKAPFGVLVAEYQDDDFKLLKRAMEQENLTNRFERVAEGANIVEFLVAEANLGNKPFQPGLILIGLNDPDQIGYEVLKHLKSDPKYRRIPVVALSDSPLEDDVFTSYDWGATSFIPKPKTFEECLSVVHSIKDYWLNVVQLPKFD